MTPIPNYVLMIGDIDIAARTIAREAGNEPWEGQVAVAEVLINRVRIALANGKGKAQVDDHCIAAACLRRLQFSAWNLNDPNRAKAMAMTGADPWYRKAEKAFMEAWLNGSDLTRGATNYFTTKRPSYAASWPPAWAKRMRHTVTIGAHEFYA